MTADSAKARAEHDLRWQAWLLIEELTAPGLDPAVSVAMLEKAFLDPLHYAKLLLTLARHRATNTTVAEPDIAGSERWCDWCGATKDLVDDSIDPSTGERIADSVWACGDLDGCLARRAERYPDDLALIQAAQDKLDLAMAAAAPTLLALSAVQAATGQHLALSAPRFGSSRRPGPPTRTTYQANRWRHTLSNPAHHRHLLSRSR